MLRLIGKILLLAISRVGQGRKSWMSNPLLPSVAGNPVCRISGSIPEFGGLTCVSLFMEVSSGVPYHRNPPSDVENPAGGLSPLRKRHGGRYVAAMVSHEPSRGLRVQLGCGIEHTGRLGWKCPKRFGQPESGVGVRSRF